MPCLVVFITLVRVEDFCLSTGNTTELDDPRYDLTCIMIGKEIGSTVHI